MRRVVFPAFLAALLGWMLEARPAPRLLLTAEDFARIERAAQALPWAAGVRTGIIQGAAGWPASYATKYGLKEWQLPPEGGQWTLWYVCPTHGVSLQYRAPNQNLCPVDGKNFTGWPYDQVIYTRRHSDNAAAARDNGLAYRFTGNLAFAREAARLLLAYADVYSSYPIKDTNNRANATSGARVTAQTLDESIWLIPMAWAYDLVADSGVLDAGGRAHIEQDLLRAAVTVVRRNDAGVSNWQSWHNAAIGAVGFTLEDTSLSSAAIDGKSGFRFQMKQSVFGDGFWYEGAWGYHFYALDAHCQLAEMASRAGIDLYAERSLRLMFEAPLRFALPDQTLPPFNDSGNTSIVSNDRLYEMAYARYGDPLFATVLGQRSRGREALFWGLDALPETASPALTSAVFPDSGNGVLRATPAADDPRAGASYLALKFGPHGGGHGHYDKLGFVYYARGGMLATDPGTQSYAAPTHNTWDKMTVAHNTIVVDQATQAEATGQLRAFAALSGISGVRAGAGSAYKQAALERAMLLTPEYALDVFSARALDGAQHRFDWVHHNSGNASTDLPLAAYSAFPATNGYQHLSESKSATTADAWRASFDANPSLTGAYGSVYTSPSDVKATFDYTRDQAASGLFSGRTHYDFSAAQGYIVFSTPTLGGQPAETPRALSLMIYGDGSGHKLALRLYDSTDERFVATVGPINWTGWRLVTVSDPARWSHYLGNDNGIFDPPVKTVGVEVTYASGGPLRGDLFVDDIVLEYAAGKRTIADFERPLRALRLWMLGAPDTTVVVGKGLGPDLLTPVPFAMARRRAAETQFVSLLEPYGERPHVTAFRALAAEQWEIAGAGFLDRVSFDSAGVLRYVRRGAGSAPLRLGLAGDAVLQDSGETLLRLTLPVPVQADFSTDGSSVALEITGPLAGELRVLAPRAERLTLNGAGVAFRREGDYRVIAAGAAPALLAAVNAASFAPQLAPGALVSIFGTNLALETRAAASLPLPDQLAGTAALINGAAIPLLYVSPLQVNAQLPFNLQPGPVQIAVRTPLGTSATAGITLGAAAPAVFGAARSGDWAVIWATGLGPVAPALPAGAPAAAQPLSSCTAPVAVTIGRKTARVGYAGLAPGSAGLYQINAQLPAGLPSGAASLVISVGGVSSNAVTLR